MRPVPAAAIVVAILLGACSATESADTTNPPTTIPDTTTTTEPLPPLGMTSPSFAEGQTIPTRFTCDGPDVNPPLDIVGLPIETAALVIVVDDPDAPLGTWDHWVEYDIPASSGDFSIEAAETEPIGTEGVNSWNLPGYGGPCPPEGEEHRYFFTVYVLSERLDLPPGIDSAGIRAAMDGKIVDEAQLMGRYAR